MSAGRGFVELRWSGDAATLHSPPDQVLRAASLDTLFIGLPGPDALAAVRVFARLDPASPWREIAPMTPAVALGRSAPGLAVPLTWPADWRAHGAIAEELKIVLQFHAGAAVARLDHIALYPRAPAASGARNRGQ